MVEGTLLLEDGVLEHVDVLAKRTVDDPTP